MTIFSVLNKSKKLRKNARSISILNPSKVSFFSENSLNAFAWLKLWTSHHTYDQPLVMTSKLYNTISRLQNSTVTYPFFRNAIYFFFVWCVCNISDFGKGNVHVELKKNIFDWYCSYAYITDTLLEYFCPGPVEEVMLIVFNYMFTFYLLLNFKYLNV